MISWPFGFRLARLAWLIGLIALAFATPEPAEKGKL